MTTAPALHCVCIDLAHTPTMHLLAPLESFLTCLRSNRVLAYPSISLSSFDGFLRCLYKLNIRIDVR